MKKFNGLTLAVLVLFLSVLVACSNDETNEPDSVNDGNNAAEMVNEGDQGALNEAIPAGTDINIAIGAGSGGMSFASLMYENYQGRTQNNYNLAIADSQEVITAGLLSGDLDIGAIPINVAATLYNASEGEIRVISLNAMGVNFVLDRTGEVETIEDLRDRTIYSAGQGGTQQHTIEFILRENGLEPGVDVEIVWTANHAETANRVLAGELDLVVLTNPFVTAVMQETDEMVMALDFTKEWEAVTNGAPLPSSSTVVRTAFLEEHPEAVRIFLQEQAAGVDFVNHHHVEVAQLMEMFGITTADVAIDSLPLTRIVAISGADLQPAVEGFLRIMYDANPDSVGGRIPDDSFFFVFDQ